MLFRSKLTGLARPHPGELVVICWRQSGSHRSGWYGVRDTRPHEVGDTLGREGLGSARVGGSTLPLSVKYSTWWTGKGVDHAASGPEGAQHVSIMTLDLTLQRGLMSRETAIGVSVAVGLSASSAFVSQPCKRRVKTPDWELEL